MNNIDLTILGSEKFTNLLNELEFYKPIITNRLLLDQGKKKLVKILFPENLKINEVKNHLLQNEPTILLIKYTFFKKSKIVIKDYEINSNERSISKNKIKIKLTEKELELILTLNNKNGLNKAYLLKSIWKHTLDLDTHAFETHLHRLRKKINKHFRDENFILEKNSLYYLVN